jgi:hypothetical protein
MLDTDTFVTTVYVIVDDFCKEHLPLPVRPGPLARLSRSELITLAIVGQWGRFASERDFYRFAEQRLRGAFPGLPDRTRYNRRARAEHGAIAQLALHLGRQLPVPLRCYEVIDCTAVPVRDSRRRGQSWFVDQTDIGYSTRLGWFYGFRLLIAVTAVGAITGYCFSRASFNDRTLADVLLAVRGYHSAATTVGQAVSNVYLADAGFAGRNWLPHWRQRYAAWVICQGQKQRWPQRAADSLRQDRQIVETVFEKLHNVFGLERERPHELYGFQMRLAAKVALHNICMRINQTHGRPLMATADLFGWA